MWEAAAIIAIVAGALLWIDSLRARERAVTAVSNQTLGSRTPATEAAARIAEVDPAAQ